MVVRNAMEDFHCEHLTDEQMRELNPIIRNAIYSGLHALANYDTSPGARAFVDHQAALVPGYWEKPELHQAFERFYETADFGEQVRLARTIDDTVLTPLGGFWRDDELLVSGDQTESREVFYQLFGTGSSEGR